MKTYPFTLEEMEIKLPPANPNTHRKKETQIHSIEYERNYTKNGNAKIVVIRRNCTNITICFKRYHKNSSHYLEVVVPQISFEFFGGNENWSPPQLCILPGGRNKDRYDITNVSWDPDYQKRFTDPDTKYRLLEKLRKIANQRDGLI